MRDPHPEATPAQRATIAFLKAGVPLSLDMIATLTSEGIIVADLERLYSA